jgi:hypothetical protein
MPHGENLFPSNERGLAKSRISKNVIGLHNRSEGRILQRNESESCCTVGISDRDPKISYRRPRLISNRVPTKLIGGLMRRTIDSSAFKRKETTHLMRIRALWA